MPETARLYPLSGAAWASLIVGVRLAQRDDRRDLVETGDSEQGFADGTRGADLDGEPGLPSGDEQGAFLAEPGKPDRVSG